MGRCYQRLSAQTSESIVTLDPEKADYTLKTIAHDDNLNIFIDRYNIEKESMLFFNVSELRKTHRSYRKYKQGSGSFAASKHLVNVASSQLRFLAEGLLLDNCLQSIDSVMENIVVQKFSETFGREPEYLVRCPGRVNLMGEHVDYNGYPTLPIAIQQAIYAAVFVDAETADLDVHNVDPQFALKQLDRTMGYSAKSET
ncbi:hypothetical protein D918_03169 [Trichuris suis]|nr:hypothetical protein D918_03169 [Trichuris suis]